MELIDTLVKIGVGLVVIVGGIYAAYEKLTSKTEEKPQQQPPAPPPQAKGANVKTVEAKEHSMAAGEKIEAHAKGDGPAIIAQRDVHVHYGESPQSAVQEEKETTADQQTFVKTETLSEPDEPERAIAKENPGDHFKNAPPSLGDIWVGREKLLVSIAGDWNGTVKRVSGLIGFGGEGKSSLAFKAVENIKAEKDSKPDCVFWWGFYESPSVDEFFEAALAHLTGGKFDQSKAPSAHAKAEHISGMLCQGRFLFVLDGMEVIQYEKGDKYAKLKNIAMRKFLKSFAEDGCQSHCVITSREPVKDLVDYQSYSERQVTNLSDAEGRQLLRKYEVKGLDVDLERVSKQWNGHAYALTLIGTLLREKFEGDIKQADQIELPEKGETPHEYTRRILVRYDEHLTDAEREFMKIFCLFRLPVEKKAFAQVFRAEMDGGLNGALTGLKGEEFLAVVDRLLTYRILNCEGERCTTHPLVRYHYKNELKKEKEEAAQGAHHKIKEYWLSNGGEEQLWAPKIENLKPFVEAAYHSCQARDYHEAKTILWERVYQGRRYALYRKLGAWDTLLAIMTEFFAEKDIYGEILVDDSKLKGFVLNEIGLALMSTGRLNESLDMLIRSNHLSDDEIDPLDRCQSQQNLAEAYISLGQLKLAEKHANNAISFANTEEGVDHAFASLIYIARVSNLLGQTEGAGRLFQKAVDKMNRKTAEECFFDESGVIYVDYLLRSGNIQYAKKVADFNYRTCSMHYINGLSQVHRQLGYINGTVDRHEKAQKHFSEGIRIARSITRRDILIGALLGRGRYFAKRGETEPAFDDLNEAFEYALDGGYRIYEADIRNALAWAYIADGKPGDASKEAITARTMSKEMGYYWGVVDADEVLAALDTES